MGLYRDDDLSGRYGYFYVLIVINISVAYAFIVLATFYTTLKSKLKPYEPVGKFLCIKFVIFFAFWQVSSVLTVNTQCSLTLHLPCTSVLLQSVIISGLVKFGVITDIGDYSADVISTGLQDFLICIEMFVTAVAHLYTFSYM